MYSARPFFRPRFAVQPLEDASRRTSNWQENFLHWLKGFQPAPLNVNLPERGRAVLGALLGILITGVLCRLYAGSATTAVWLIAPLGASAVLVFAVPSSPLAQPWSVVGGNTLSTLVGVACVHFIDDPAIAAGVAAGGAIAVMFTFRCLHPPGGAAALLTVLTHSDSLGYVLFPVLTNSVLLAIVGIVYNSATGRRYPHSQLVERPGTIPYAMASSRRFSSEDLDTVLQRYNQVLDVSRDELEHILHMAEMNAVERRMSDRCGWSARTGPSAS